MENLLKKLGDLRREADAIGAAPLEMTPAPEGFDGPLALPTAREIVTVAAALHKCATNLGISMLGHKEGDTVDLGLVVGVSTPLVDEVGKTVALALRAAGPGVPATSAMKKQVSRGAVDVIDTVTSALKDIEADGKINADTGRIWETAKQLRQRFAGPHSLAAVEAQGVAEVAGDALEEIGECGPSTHDGQDGENGENGQDGENGENGQDGQKGQEASARGRLISACLFAAQNCSTALGGAERILVTAKGVAGAGGSVESCEAISVAARRISAAIDDVIISNWGRLHGRGGAESDSDSGDGFFFDDGGDEDGGFDLGEGEGFERQADAENAAARCLDSVGSGSDAALEALSACRALVEATRSALACVTCHDDGVADVLNDAVRFIAQIDARLDDAREEIENLSPPGVVVVAQR